MRKCIVALIFLYWFYNKISSTTGFHWNKISTSVEGKCAMNNMKLLSLLNLMCNTTQTTSIQMRDACYGCFFRAGSLIDGSTQLTSLNDCSKLYIMESVYSTCATNLKGIVDDIRPQTLSEAIKPSFCSMGYCEFVRCIRKINAQQLISSCYAENLGESQLDQEPGRIYFFTNITACILAKSRCSQYNPITGELQIPNIPQILKNKVSGVATAAIGYASLYSNSLQIDENGDISLLTLPSSIYQNDVFCSRQPLVRQAGYNTYNC